VKEEGDARVSEEWLPAGGAEGGSGNARVSIAGSRAKWIHLR
jgi:hypothetical protein